MIPLSAQKIKVAVKGRTKHNSKYIKATVLKVETDTRGDLTDALFIALKGPRFDGHDFIQEAFDKGAVCVISEREEDLARNKPVIKVESTHKALKDLAKNYITNFKIPIVAVTGSVGKTTTKDMIASVLSTKYKTFKTEGNFNNEIGLPLSVLKLDKSYQAAVFELGMSNFGEIHELADIVRPDICVITNIGYSHIENLGSREGILSAKTEILDFYKPSGKIILNGDDDMLITLESQYSNIKYYGIEEKNYFYADNIREDGLWGITCCVQYEDNRFFVKVPLPGKHMVQNTLAAVGVGWALKLSPTAIKNGIENFRPSKLRMDIRNTPAGITVINDTYNASPASMIAALDVLSVVKTRKICILGDMLELGEKSPEYHYGVGKHAAEKNINLILCVGEMAEHIFNGASDYASINQEVVYFKTKEKLLEKLSDITNEGDTVLVKASRAMMLENIVEFLKKR